MAKPKSDRLLAVRLTSLSGWARLALISNVIPGNMNTKLSAPRWLQMLTLTLVFGIVLAAVAIMVAELGPVSFPSRSPARSPAESWLAALTPARTPASRLPGPPRKSESPVFTLTDQNSRKMQGRNDPVNERWYDIADNPYSSWFVSEFSYEPQPGRPRVPEVRVRVDPEGLTFSGRLEARGLKPNFAYQIKLRGIFEHRRNFETIGFLGRWRLPGLPTNYGDRDYFLYPDKSRVEAYLLFDFFATDRHGNAIREFALDSSFHVLFKESQIGSLPASDLVPAAIDASDPIIYASPRRQLSLDFLWPEPETARYTSGNRTIRLPPGEYNAELVLTEESFHSMTIGGGYWATVLACPVTFTVTPPGVEKAGKGRSTESAAKSRR